MRPYDLEGEDEDLQNDNHEVGDFWMLTDGYRVTLSEQRRGESPTQHITIPRAQFNKLIDWYMREQKSKAA